MSEQNTYWKPLTRDERQPQDEEELNVKYSIYTWDRHDKKWIWQDNRPFEKMQEYVKVLESCGYLVLVKRKSFVIKKYYESPPCGIYTYSAEAVNES